MERYCVCGCGDGGIGTATIGLGSKGWFIHGRYRNVFVYSAFFGLGGEDEALLFVWSERACS